jgi:uncharacterized protein YaaN involved in tellurite resistance
MEMEIQHGSSPTALALINESSLKLSDRLTPHSDAVRKASDSLLAAAKVGEVENAGILLTGMVKELEKMKTPPTGFIGRFIADTKWGVRQKLLARKAVRTVLEEMKSDFERSRDKLRANIVLVEELAAASRTTAGGLQETIRDMEKEKTELEVFYATLEAGSEERRNASSALQRYEKSVADAKGLLFLHQTTAAQLSVQIQERETLYSTMSSLGPQLDVLLKQQLAQLVSQAEVRAATKQMQALRDGVRAVAVENARQTREDAVAVAKVANEPIIDEATILKLSDELIGMAADVKAAVKAAIENGQRAGQAAEEQAKRITAAVRSLEYDQEKG